MVTLDETIVGIWYVQMNEVSDWLASISTIPGEQDKHALVYRFRYYTDAEGAAFDSDDIKSWYRGLITGNRERVIEVMREAALLMSAISTVPDVTPYECIHSGTMDEFMDAFSKLPFVHMKIVDSSGKEIPMAPSTNIPKGKN